MSFLPKALAETVFKNKKLKKLVLKVLETKCYKCGAKIPPGRPGRDCKTCRGIEPTESEINNAEWSEPQ